MTLYGPHIDREGLFALIFHANHVEPMTSGLDHPCKRVIHDTHQIKQEFTAPNLPSHL